MRFAICLSVLATGLALAGEDEAKVHTFKRADVPKSIKAKAGDSIVIIEDVKPQDLESMTANSTSADVTIKSQTVGNKVQIEIRPAKKGKAIVKWRYETKVGTIGGHDGLELEIE